MSSRVVKIVACDRCGETANAVTVTESAPGWGRFARPGVNLDVCLTCGRAVEEWIKYDHAQAKAEATEEKA